MGKNANLVWYVYGTPHNPIACPILSLASYLFSNPGIITSVPTSQDDYNQTTETNVIDPDRSEGNISINGYTKLFPGCNQYDRFIKSFRKVVCENAMSFVGTGLKMVILDLIYHERSLAVVHLCDQQCLCLLCLFVCMQPGV